MENASKALLIAAAVLIVILVVAFGVSLTRTGIVAGNVTEITDTTEDGIKKGTSVINDVVQKIDEL